MFRLVTLLALGGGLPGCLVGTALALLMFGTPQVAASGFPAVTPASLGLDVGELAMLLVAVAGLIAAGSLAGRAHILNGRRQ